MNEAGIIMNSDFRKMASTVLQGKQLGGGGDAAMG